MVSPRVDPLLQTSDLPRKVDVVVIGGGIIGASTALCLAERGVSVALCEKGRIAGEQSSRNWGWCRKMGRDPAEIPLAVESLRLWERMSARTGADTGFRANGIVYLCANAREAEGHEAMAGAGPVVPDRFPADRDRTRSTGSCPGRRAAGPPRSIRPATVAPSRRRRRPRSRTRRSARARRCWSSAPCAASRHRRAAVSGVVTEQGAIRCGQVVLAGGAWSSLFCGNLGIRFPQLKILGSVMRTGPIAAPEPAVGAGDFAFRKRLDGGYTVAQRNANIAEIVPDSFRFLGDFLPGLVRQWHEIRIRVGRRFLEEWNIPRRWALDAVTPFEKVRTLDPEPSAAVLDQGERNLSKAFPAFAGVKIVERWAGLIDVTPDAVPVISAVPAVPGFFIASGFSGHGFGIGPGAGQLMADLVTGARPIVDPTPYRYERFAKTVTR